MKNARSRSLVSIVIAGVVASTWCVAGVAASPSSYSAATPKSSGGADRSIIIVGGRSGSMMPLNPQPLPPRWR